MPSSFGLTHLLALLAGLVVLGGALALSFWRVPSPMRDMRIEIPRENWAVSPQAALAPVIPEPASSP